MVDASVAVEFLLGMQGAPAIEERLFRDRLILTAPELLDVEVLQVLRRYALGGELSETRGEDAARDLADLPIERYSHTMLLPRVWELRSNLTAYDAVYVALAEELGATLLTRDSRLARAPGIVASIELVE